MIWFLRQRTRHVNDSRRTEPQHARISKAFAVMPCRFPLSCIIIISPTPISSADNCGDKKWYEKMCKHSDYARFTKPPSIIDSTKLSVAFRLTSPTRAGCRWKDGRESTIRNMYWFSMCQRFVIYENIGYVVFWVAYMEILRFYRDWHLFNLLLAGFKLNYSCKNAG